MAVTDGGCAGMEGEPQQRLLPTAEMAQDTAVGMACCSESCNASTVDTATARSEASSVGASTLPLVSSAAGCGGTSGCCGDDCGKPTPLREAERRKALGNAAFQDKNYLDAARFYSEAIELAGDDALPVYFSNRAVCRAAQGEWEGARQDAAEALRRPDAPQGVVKKALFQKARAEFRLQRPEAVADTLQAAETRGLRADVEKLLREEATAEAQRQANQQQAAASTVVPAGAAGAAVSSAQSPAPAPRPAAATATSTMGADSAGVDQASDLAARAKEAGTSKYKEGAYREALAEYQRALGLLPGGDKERRAQLLGNVAAACLMLRQIEECCSSCEQALALEPSSSKIRARLATAQVASGDFAAARATLAAAPHTVVGNDAVLANAAKLIDDTKNQLESADRMLVSGEPARALGQYADIETKAMYASPELALKMGRCYLELKNYPRVLNATQQVLRANPRNIDALVLRTEALYRNNNVGVDARQWADSLEQGQKLLKEALSFDPDHAGAQALRKRLRALCNKHVELRDAMDSREFEKAREVLDAMIELGRDNPVMLAGLFCERAKAGIRLKDYVTVLKDVGQATYRNHELVQAYVYRAQALQALDRFDDAVKELEGLFAWHREQSVYDKLQEAKFLLRRKKRANYYELLGVPSIASQLEIKKAYRERASEWHPDKKGHLDEAGRRNAEDMFKRIGEAYEVLTDGQKKELYDKGYDLEGIEEQIELKKRRTEHGHGHGHCC